MKELIQIQAKLKAPKNQFNNFGKYNYRSCEDILEGVKPLLHEHGAVLTVSDRIVNVGNRIYVEATARISVEEKYVEVTAYAREAENKKGMDDAQITGSASSYARKYALNGLFLIDDTKDDDSGNTPDENKTKPEVLPDVNTIIEAFEKADQAKFKTCLAKWESIKSGFNEKDVEKVNAAIKGLGGEA